MPRKPARTCTTPGCRHLQPCPDHAPKPWAGSTRAQLVASGWQQQRDNQRILRRHAFTCHVCGLLGAMVVDHVIPLAEGGTDTDDNKRPIHGGPGSCHARKSAAEAARGRARRQAHA